VLTPGRIVLVYKINQRTGCREVDGHNKLIRKYNCPDMWEVEDAQGRRFKRFVYEEDQRPVLHLLK
jgi:hypothetical protein